MYKLHLSITDSYLQLKFSVSLLRKSVNYFFKISIYSIHTFIIDENLIKENSKILSYLMNIFEMLEEWNASLM